MIGQTRLPRLDFRGIYDRFDAPVTHVDCGQRCAVHNPSGKPFCCDIHHAVPAVYDQEWMYLQKNTGLWKPWRGDESDMSEAEVGELREQTPENMVLLACQGPSRCQRPFRSMSCRQFPFFPYISSNDRFIGLAYEWQFEQSCWVISNLPQVTPQYREEFVRTYDALFDHWPDEFEAYAVLSADMREHFLSQKRRIPLLHRGGEVYLISPGSERTEKIDPARLPKFGPYRLEITEESGK